MLDCQVQADRLNEAIALLEHVSPWAKAGHIPEYTGAAVYFIRLANSTTPLPSAWGEDCLCILYIGETSCMTTRAIKLHEKPGTRRKPRLFSRVDWLPAACLRFGSAYPNLQYEYCYVGVETKAQAEHWNSYFMSSYYHYYGDLPSMNRSFEKKGSRKKPAHDLVWKQVDPMGWARIQKCLQAIPASTLLQ